MEISNLIVQDIVMDGGEPYTQSTLYEFGKKRWISLNRGRQGRKLGPATLLAQSDEDQNALKDITVRTFPRAPLSDQGGKIYLQDEWTVKGCSVYAVMLPAVCVSPDLQFQISAEGIKPRMSVTADGRIFYHLLTGEEQVQLQIAGHIVHDPAQHSLDVESALHGPRPSYIDGFDLFEYVGARGNDPNYWSDLGKTANHIAAKNRAAKAGRDVSASRVSLFGRITSPFRRVRR